jgi:hypothetical protein
VGNRLLQAGDCGAKKAGVIVCGKMLKTRAAFTPLFFVLMIKCRKRRCED